MVIPVSYQTNKLIQVRVTALLNILGFKHDGGNTYRKYRYTDQENQRRMKALFEAHITEISDTKRFLDITQNIYDSATGYFIKRKPVIK